MRTLKIASCLAFVLTLALPLSAFAASFYTSGGNGYDISYNSSAPYPIPIDFGIVGVTDGRAYGTNANLATEFEWAQQAAGPSLYMNLNAPVGSTVKGNTSSPKTCSKKDKACQAYNYGYNAAASAYTYATSQSVSASLWWLDIETANSWTPTAAINIATIQGATDYLTQQGAQVGIYSTPGMWDAITGGWNSGAPEWLAIGSATQVQAAAACSNASFTGGSIWLVQYLIGGDANDHDYSC